MNCDDGVYTATFQPDEAGTWKISVTYEDEHIQDSPFTCFVFDPHAVTVGPHLYRVSTGFLIIIFFYLVVRLVAQSLCQVRIDLGFPHPILCIAIDFLKRIIDMLPRGHDPKWIGELVLNCYRGSRPKARWGTCFFFKERIDR